MQNLHIYINIEDLISGFNPESNTISLKMHDFLSDYSAGNEPYGFSLLRQTIKEYETENNISLNDSKQSMPFFRDYQCRLIGPEVTPFSLSLFEDESTAMKQCYGNNKSGVIISIDYSELAQQALMENMFLIKCKYDVDENKTYLKEQLKREYDKVFFDSENTGFSPDSRFFSLLCNACLNIDKPENADFKEWRIVTMSEPENAIYILGDNNIKTASIFPLPVDAIKKIRLVPDYQNNTALYSTLIGWMKKYRLSPETKLEGLLE